MLLTLTLLSWSLSIIFIFLNHPMSFGLMILLQTIIISMISGILNYDYWFSYILLLIMIGGMLVLFIYMTSIASNEKFKFSNKIMLYFIFTSLIMFFFINSDNFLISSNMMNFDLMNQSNYNINLSLNKLMNLPMMMMMILLIMYLLITLIAVVKITESKLGPLRQMN